MKLLIVGLLFALSQMLSADTVIVSMEESVPFVDEKGEPIVQKIFRDIEKISDLTFEVRRIPYARALVQLHDGLTDMVVHVPYQAEPGFDDYGLYMDWTIPVKADLVSLNANRFSDLTKIGDKRIGVPRGNVPFASTVTELPANMFFEAASLKSLVSMLKLGRIDLIWFDRVSLRQELQAQNIQNAFYYELPVFGKVGSIGIGFQKSARGYALKQRLEMLFLQVDQTDYLAPYFKYLQPDLPRSGPIVFANPAP